MKNIVLKFDENKVLNTRPMVDVIRQGEQNIESITITGPTSYGIVSDITDLTWVVAGIYRSHDFTAQQVVAGIVDEDIISFSWIPDEQFSAYGGDSFELELIGENEDGTQVIKIVSSQDVYVRKCERKFGQLVRSSLEEMANAVLIGVQNLGNSVATAAASATKAAASATKAAASATAAAASATEVETSTDEIEKTVDAKIATKANTADVETALAAKANTADVETALAAKANTADVETALAAKANTADVETALAAKANTADVETALQQSDFKFYAETSGTISVAANSAVSSDLSAPTYAGYTLVSVATKFGSTGAKNLMCYFYGTTVYIRNFSSSTLSPTVTIYCAYKKDAE